MGGASKECVHALFDGNASTATTNDVFGFVDPDRALIAIFGELTREKTARNCRCLLRCTSREITCTVLRRIIRARQNEPARIRLERGGIFVLCQLFERRNGSV